MKDMMWNSPDQLRKLVCELVSWDSRTGTKGEIDFANKIQEKLLCMNYFKEKTDHIQLHDAGEGRNAVTAFYESGVTDRTITLISHFDTVHTVDFGELENLAFQPELLTETFKSRLDMLPKDAQQDVLSDNYLFGRGTMDMKMGLALHLHLLEKASIEKWPINLMLLTVPDEEVNSAGMRSAVKGLVALREKHNITYDLFLNSEPSFSQIPQDENYYIYSGTIGKIMPSALFYGKETHAGEPLGGLTGHYMASYLTKAMEFNEDFIEEVYGEKTPLPVCLKSNDLKQDYSTQTSHHSYALYNVFVMKRNAKEVMDIFRKIAQKAMAACEKEYHSICKQVGAKPIGDIKVIDYTHLVTFAEEKLGASKVKELMEEVMRDKTKDERETAVQICDVLMMHCQELAPATVLFFAPPYYPAINSSDHKIVQEKIKLTQQTLENKFGTIAKQIHYFNGISDLSYVNYDAEDKGWYTYKNNTPVWGDVYSIPFKEMQQLQAPVLNIGPFGKDAHKLTERLHTNSAFVETPYVLTEVIKSLFCQEVNA